MFEGAGRSLRRESEKRGREQGLKEGIQQGKESTLLENIQSLVEQLHLTPEQAMDALRVPSQDREGIRKKLLPSS
jgi:predicted transposase YdaD